MPRLSWSLDAYHMLQPDEQLDMFSCREKLCHGVERQLALAEPVDQTLCGQLLPARPRWEKLDNGRLRARDFCPHCREVIARQRKLPRPGWPG